MTKTEILRKIFSQLIQKISNIFIQLGFTANDVTIMGFIGNIIASILITKGFLVTGGIFAGLSCLLDALDGTIAKSDKGRTLYGSFLDSTLDRFSEFSLFFGLVLHFDKTNFSLGVIITFIAFGGSILVSYIRAKAESVGISLKQGLLTRVERLVILIVSLLIKQPFYGLMIISVFGFFTVIQRFWIARKVILEKEMKNK